MRATLFAVLVGALHGSAPSYAADEGLFGEPALDEVLYGSARGSGSAYQFPAYNSLDVLTQRNDNNRSGASHWPGINQNSVKQFRKVGELLVDDDAVVTAQPLYVDSAVVQNVRQSVVIVATSKNDVFAFAPFSVLSATPAQHWRTGLGEPLRANDDDVPQEGADCGIRPNAAHSSLRGSPYLIGIDGTPVVDLANNQVLVGYKTADGYQRLAALDLNDGHVKNFVKVPTPHAAANPDWRRLHRNRASLLLVDGVVYLAFSSLCEGTAAIMHGSLVAFDARTLDHVGEFQVTDDHTDGGGIWQGSTGPAADADGNLYFVTGNRRLLRCLSGSDKHGVGIPDNTSAPDAANLSNSVVRLKIEKRTATGNPALSDQAYSLRTTIYGYFTPYRKLLGDCWDLDLGSAGPLLIPGTPFVVAGGKEGLIYVLDRSEMGGFDRAGKNWEYANVSTKVIKQKHDEVLKDEAKHDRVHQKFLAGENTFDSTYLVTDLMKWPHIHGTPVFARFGADRAFMFVWPEKDRIKRYQWNGNYFDPVPVKGKERAPPNLDDGNNGMPGGMLSVNIDPSGPSLGVVLAAVKICDAPEIEYSNPGYPQCNFSQDWGILRAYDPFTMKLVWSNEYEYYWFSKFVPPTIAAGQIFLPTASGKVIIYGP